MSCYSLIIVEISHEKEWPLGESHMHSSVILINLIKFLWNKHFKKTSGGPVSLVYCLVLQTLSLIWEGFSNVAMNYALDLNGKVLAQNHCNSIIEHTFLLRTDLMLQFPAPWMSKVLKLQDSCKCQQIIFTCRRSPNTNSKQSGGNCCLH